jgi:IclR family transcriptional regulator, KDG regulon repressor
LKQTASRSTLRSTASQDKPADTSAVSTTVAKAIGILEVLAAQAERGITLADLCVQLSMPKSTVHRYLTTLTQLGLAERRGDDRYRLGTKVIELAGSFLANSDLRSESQPVLDNLAAQSDETVHLAVPSGTEVVYIAKVESAHPLRMYSYIGARLPMYCTALGKVILAFGDSDRTREVLARKLRPRTPTTITTADGLHTELESVRAQGYAIDDEENEVGIRCVSAPILDYTRLAVAAMSISGPSDRMDRRRCLELAPLVREAAHRLSRRMGYAG